MKIRLLLCLQNLWNVDFKLMQTIDYMHMMQCSINSQLYSPHHYNINQMADILRYITEYFKYHSDISHNTSDINQTYHKAFQISLLKCSYCRWNWTYWFVVQLSNYLAFTEKLQFMCECTLVLENISLKILLN